MYLDNQFVRITTERTKQKEFNYFPTTVSINLENPKMFVTCFRLCLRVLRGGEGKGRKGREGREGRKEGKPSPCLRVKETNKERRWRAYVIILLFYHFSFKINTL